MSNYEYTAEYLIEKMQQKLREKRITAEDFEKRLIDTYHRRPVPKTVIFKNHTNGEDV